MRLYLCRVGTVHHGRNRWAVPTLHDVEYNFPHRPIFQPPKGRRKLIEFKYVIHKRFGLNP